MKRVILPSLVMAVAIGVAGCSSTGATYQARDVSEKNPAEVNAQLGIEYMRKGKYEVAMEKLNKAVDQDPGLQLAQVSLAILNERLGEDEQADKHYRKAYNLDRKDPVTLNAYGQFLCRKGDLQEANDMFVQALKDPLYQHQELILSNAGICALKQPDRLLAEKYFRSALQIQPKYAPALREMVSLTFEDDEYLATRAYLQRLQEVAPLTPPYLWIGVQAESSLQNVDAVSSYGLLLKNRYPDAEETRTLIEWERKLGER